MKKIYKEYGEILFIDATYKINVNNYSVYLFVVIDGDGKSQIVGFALTAYKREACIETIVNMFVTSNQDSIGKTNCIMTDKDLLEAKVLHEHFPHANMLLCKWHVLKNFHDYYKSNIKLEEILMKMVNTRSISQYNEFKEELKQVENIEKNWENIEEKWVPAYSEHLSILNSHTYNRVESMNAVLKRHISRTSRA